MQFNSAEDMNNWSTGLPVLLGFEVVAVEAGFLKARMPVREDLLAPNGYLHAASVIGLADSACGFGTMFDLPADAKGFTTIELKSNFTGTTLKGVIWCEARRVHGGRTTQVWDAEVRVEDTDRTICLFRCTQMILR